MGEPKLFHLPQSPWSEKARWALEHHSVTYRAIEHLPMLYEPVLRVMSGDIRKKPSVPMLVDGKTVVRDSLDIALWAEQHGKGSPLFPKGSEGAIFGWNDRAEQLLRSARSRLMDRLVAHDGALLEAVPPPLSKLGRSLLPVARMGASFVARKYDTRGVPPAASEASITEVMERAESAVASRSYLVGDGFTFADI